MTRQSSWGKLLVPLLLVTYLLALLVFVLLASHDPQAPLPAAPQEAVVQPPEIVPRFHEITEVGERKQAFFDFMRPLVARENSLYQQERERLLAVIAKLDAGGSLSRGDKRKLIDWAETFAVADDLSVQDQIKVLQRRINTIPESMVLAQAAIESAWGRSRFARKGNNFFGQWCYTPGCGLVPLRRNQGSRHEVRKFDSVQDAVSAYFININTHRAYRALREQRLALEQAGEDFTGHVLVGQLKNYSQRGQMYVDELRSIIRGNNLE